MRLDQTLHGYKDGHRLLRTSRELPAATQRQMLLLSDMSGSTMLRGFEEYLTGYPLPEIGVYAIARTWYAREMRRPGCVWTHTLLCSFAHLDHIVDHEPRGHDGAAQVSWLRLACLFRRPAEGETDPSYDTTLLLDGDRCSNQAPEDSSLHDTATFRKDNLRRILQGVYGTPGRPVLLVSSESTSQEALAVAIWLQQWPRLRRNFTFCTGALAPRYFNDRPFDLQITAPGNVRLFLRELEEALLADDATDNGEQFPSAGQTWLETAVADLRERGAEDQGWFRSFLRTYSGDLSASRTAFLPLAQIHDDLHRRNPEVPIEDAAALIERLALFFPAAREARRLKRHALGPEVERSQASFASVGWYSEPDLLSALATTQFHAAFEAADLKLGERASIWAGHDLSNVGTFLAQVHHTKVTPFGEEVLGGLLASISVNDAVALTREQPRLVSLFASVHPTLAEVPEMWRHRSHTEQRELLDVLVRTPEVRWDRVVSAMLEADADGVADVAVRQCPRAVVRAVLAWLHDDGVTRCLPRPWQRALAAAPSALVDWLAEEHQAKPSAIAFVLTLLDPHGEDVRRVDDQIWLRFAEQALVRLDAVTLADAMAFVLAVAFDNYVVSAPRLAVLSFEIVHDMAARQPLGCAAWRALQPYLPVFDRLRDWDKCEKLRQALVNRFVVCGWPAEFLLAAVRNERSFRWVVEYCKRFTEGNELLRQLRQRIVQNPTLGTDAQKAVLFKKDRSLLSPF